MEQMSDSALSYRDATLDECTMDLRDTAVLGVAQATHQGNDVETELTLGQNEGSFLLRTIRLVEPGAVPIPAGSDHEGEGHQTLEGGDGAMAVVGHPERTITQPAASVLRLKEAVGGGNGTRVTAWHGEALLLRRDARPYQLPPSPLK